MQSHITFTVILEENSYAIKSYVAEYRSLMALLYDKLYIDEDFGECKGMGRCGTCVIEILNSTERITFSDRNETTTLTKIGIDGKNIHLSCQIEVDENLNGSIIKICTVV